MNMHREALLERLTSIKEPMAQPTVQTMDMGIEYCAASSDGATCVLGTYGAWPAHGPFMLSSDDLHRLYQANCQNTLEENFVEGMQLEYIWTEISEMFEYFELDKGNRQKFQKRFLELILNEKLNADQEFYIYFHKYNENLPLLFKSHKSLIDYFMSLQDLISWHNMTTDELESWLDTLEEIDDFAILSPVCDD